MDEDSDFSADLLFTDGGQRAGISVATAHATIVVPNIERYLVDMTVLGRRFSLDLLGNSLHEGAHHQSLSTLVGSSLSLLAADVRQRIARGETEHPATLHLLARYEFAITVFAPLFEGIAVFAEHDLYMGKGDVCPLLLGHLASKIAEDIPRVDNQQPLEAQIAALADQAFEQFNTALIVHRYSDAGLQRKMTVLRNPYRLRHSGGYLLGYLLVKRFWGVCVRAKGRRVESSLFYEFLQNAIFNDPLTAGFLLQDPDTHSPDKLKGELRDVAGCIFNRLLWIEKSWTTDFLERFAALAADDQSGILRFFDTYAEPGQSYTEGALSLIQKKLDALPSTLGGDGNELHMRSLFRIATGPVRVRFGKTKIFLLDTLGRIQDSVIGIPMLAATNPVTTLPEGDYEGIADIFINMQSGIMFGGSLNPESISLPDAIAAVTVGETIVALYHDDHEKRGSYFEQIWAEAIKHRTGTTLAVQERLIASELAPLKMSTGWRAAWPVLLEQMHAANVVYQKWSAAIDGQRLAEFAAATDARGLAGFFSRDEEEMCLKLIVEGSAWASASQDDLAESVPKSDVTALGRVSDVFDQYGATLLWRATDPPVCCW